MRRRATLLAIPALGLALAATSLAQGGGSERPLIKLPSGCIAGTRVTLRIVPKRGTLLSPVHIRAGRREAVHLTGVTQEASVTVRVYQVTRVSVSGETAGGERFAKERVYRRCERPAPGRGTPVTGGGEG